MDRSDQPFDVVERPQHYNSHPSGIEAIELTEQLPFCLGSALKYAWRAGLKNATLEDWKKCRWYLVRERERLRQARPGLCISVPLELPPLARNVIDHEERRPGASKGLLAVLGLCTRDYVNGDDLDFPVAAVEAEIAWRS